MGRHRYHCSHCNTSFPYTTQARRQHYAGAVHRLKAVQHYRSHMSAVQRYAAACEQPPCRQHASAAGCSYGESCKYSHVLPGELQRMQREAEEERLLEEYGPLPLPSTLCCDPCSVQRLLDRASGRPSSHLPACPAAHPPPCFSHPPNRPSASALTCFLPTVKAAHTPSQKQ